MNEGPTTKGSEKMKEYTKSHTWETGSGHTVTATARLKLKDRINADGQIVYVDCCEFDLDIRIAGMGRLGSDLKREPVTINGVEYPATFGKLAISADSLAAIDAIIADVQAHPAYQDKLAKRAKYAREKAEDDERSRRIEKAMAM